MTPSSQEVEPAHYPGRFNVLDPRSLLPRRWGPEGRTPPERLAKLPLHGWVAHTPLRKVRRAGVIKLVVAAVFLLTALDVGFLADQPWIAGIAAIGALIHLVRSPQPTNAPTFANLVFGTFALAAVAFATAIVS